MERPAKARTGRGGFGAGANVAEIARRADLRPNQIYRWLRQMGQAVRGGLAKLHIGISGFSA
ncbi:MULTISPECIES: transposase [unclassified Sphingobium]|uniref:transposase n=1 Tax=unclassified Sphingobium TaxID=2611147 RepID=UPI001E49DF1A|nr:MULTISPECIES: transposase [unclassified Sphingobium]